MKRLAAVRTVLVGALVVFAVAEGTLRLLAWAVPPVELLLSGREIPSVVRDENLGQRHNPDHPDHDSRGFRNPSVPDRADVVAFGDSQTYGANVPRELIWTQVLEGLGDLRCYNMACGTWGPAHSLFLWDESRDLGPPIAIEAFYSGNDLYDCYVLVHKRRKLVHLGTADSTALRAIGELEKTDPFDKKIAEILYEGGQWSRPKEGGPEGGPDGGEERVPITRKIRRALTDHVQVGRLLRAARKRVRSALETPPTPDEAWAETLRRYENREEYSWTVETGGFRMLFTPAYRHLAIDMDDPRIREGFDIAIRANEELAERASREGSRFLVLLIPTKELVFRELIERNDADIPHTFRELVRKEAAFWKATKERLDALGIEYVDALPALRACLDRSESPYPMDDGHKNEIGHRAVAEAVAERVAQTVISSAGRTEPQVSAAARGAVSER